MKDLEQYLKENYERGAIDHIIRASVDQNGKVSFYIHPHGVDGDTLDFEIIQLKSFTVLKNKY